MPASAVDTGKVVPMHRSPDFTAGCFYCNSHNKLLLMEIRRYHLKKPCHP